MATEQLNESQAGQLPPNAHDSPPQQDDGSPPQQDDESHPGITPEKRQKEIQQTEVESLAFTIVKAEAVRTYRRGLKNDLKNPTEIALGRLGMYLARPMVKAVGTGEPLATTYDNQGKYRGGVLEKNHPHPRLKQSSNTGEWVPAYDRRANPNDTERTSMIEGVIELTTFSGKTTDGAYHFFGIDHNDSALDHQIVLSENDFVKAFMLAQQAELAQGLEQDAPLVSAESGLNKASVRTVIASMVGACSTFAEHYDQQNEDTLDIVGRVDEKSVVEALKDGNVGITREAGITLVQSMLTYNRKNIDNLSDKKITDNEALLNRTLAEIQAGIQPSADQLYSVLVLVGEPGLRTQLHEAKATIHALKIKIGQTQNSAEKEKLEKELKDAQQEIEFLENVLNKKKGNDVYHLLEDAQSGKIDADLLELLNKNITDITDPKGFFTIGVSDLDKPNSLGNIIARYFGRKHGVDDTKVISWLSTFLKEHGSDIAMMGIFALFQMMSGIIGDAAKSASH